MSAQGSNDQFSELERNYAGYTVYDESGKEIGPVDDLFVDENDNPEYVGIRTGSSGTRSIVIPMDVITADQSSRALTVSQPEHRVKDGPSFADDEEITPDYERQVREYYGLGAAQGERGDYGDYYGEEVRKGFGTSYHGSPGDPSHPDSMGNAEEERRDTENEGGSVNVGTGMTMGDTETGRFRGHGREQEGVNQREGRDLADEDELRVQRSEEELRAGVRDREAGKIRVRKRVRTDRERISVPKRREEVTVERVAVDREGTRAEIGEDEIEIPIVEEEIVVEKRPVVKEEVRLRKDVVEDEEVIEADVRKEEIEIDDDTSRRDR